MVTSSLADHAIGMALGNAIGVPIADPWSPVVLERAIATALLAFLFVSGLKRIARARERSVSDRSRRSPSRLRAAR